MVADELADGEAVSDYAAFLAGKRHEWTGVGQDVPESALPSGLYPFQAALTRWALRKGRAALWADTGLGKTRMQVAWASQIPGRVLILAPLCVGPQTIAEAARIGVTVAAVGSGARIEVANYERLHQLDPAAYTGVVLDESSILKAFDGKTRGRLIAAFQDTPYRLCCTATPAPNDIAELANHAEFLGVMTRAEMLATWFVHVEREEAANGWRLKGHAHAAFYRWLASWGLFLRRPSDLGFADDGYLLPPLDIAEIIVDGGGPTGEYLFPALGLGGLRGRLDARRNSIRLRVIAAVEVLLRAWTSESTCGNGPNGTGNTSAPIEQRPGSAETPAVETLTGPIPFESESRCALGTVLTQGANGPDDCALSTGSGRRNTRRSSKRSSNAAGSAGQSAAPSTSTMTTSMGTFGASSVPHATLPLGSLATIQRLSDALRSTLSARPRLSPWVIWCGLNAEQDQIAALLGDLCVSVQGKTREHEKIEMERKWRSGEVPAMVTKAEVFGWGMNWQHCPNMVFLGLGDSYELYYQAIRRCWRFGQTRPVSVRIVVSDAEQAVVQNVRRKEQEAQAVAEDLIRSMREAEREEIGATGRHREVADRAVAQGEGWQLDLGDCVEVLAEWPEASVDLSVYSPPFIALYTYTNSERDVGNSRDRDEFMAHMRYVVRALGRVTKPGRLTCCHVAQVPAQKAKDGFIGMFDLRGPIIALFQSEGWIYHGDVTIDKDPQAQAIRTKSKALAFQQLKKDASWLRPALADYILVFRAPGDNAVPISPDITNDDWIEWARPIWYGLRESDTLNAREAREHADDRHVCPLQLGTIERCIRLWSNPGELVADPFAGIGSTGYEAIRLGRRFRGVELKRTYWEAATRNLQRMEQTILTQGRLL